MHQNIQYPHILTAKKYLDKHFSDIELKHEVKIVDIDVPYDKYTTLTDLSINARGEDEDKIYLKKEFLIKNIRRGNTIITCINRNNITYEYWGRKGLEKFFYLDRQYIQINLGQIIPPISSHYPKNDSQEIQKLIFKDIQKSQDQGNYIQTLKITKGNGVNAQISYIKEINSFLIASNNLSLVAQYENDIESFKGYMYEVVRVIAHEWFKILGRLINKIDDLQKLMQGKTFIGEYCGNQNYQRIVKYEKIDIFFFAIVDNNSQYTCISPELSQQIFKKYGLSSLELQDCGQYNNFIKLNERLLEIYDQTIGGDISQEQEGCVLYFVETGKTLDQDHVLSICQLNTLEYQIYKLLQEKLGNFINNKRQRKTETQKKFFKEMTHLVREQKTAKELNYYQKIAEVAFNFAEQYEKQNYLVSDYYTTFLSIVFYCVQKEIQIIPDVFSEKNVEILIKIPWKDYINQKIEINDERPTKNLVIFMPVSIFGTAKSILKQYLQSSLKELEFDLLSIKPMIKENNQYIWDDKMKDTIRNLSKFTAFNRFLFVDQLHSQEETQLTIAQINECIPKDVVCINILIYPEILQDKIIRIDKDITIPFSPYFILHCLQRLQKKIQKTQIDYQIQILKALFTTISKFINVTLNQFEGINRIFFFPFHLEEKNQKFTISLLEILKQILKIYHLKQQPTEQILTEFLKQFDMEKIKIKDVEQVILERESSKICYECIQLINRDIVDTEKIKVPAYLGAFVDNIEMSQKETEQFIETGMEILQKSFRKDNVFSIQDLKKSQILNINIFEMGRDPSKLENPFFINFKEDQELIVKINTFLFVPGQLLIGIFFKDNNKTIEFENSVPYMDLMEGNSLNTQTKIILEQVISNEIIKKKIEQGSFYEENYTFCKKITEVKVEEGKVIIAYMFKSNETINYNCTTRAFYGDYNEIINLQVQKFKNKNSLKNDLQSDNTQQNQIKVQQIQDKIEPKINEQLQTPNIISQKQDNQEKPKELNQEELKIEKEQIIEQNDHKNEKYEEQTQKYQIKQQKNYTQNNSLSYQNKSKYQQYDNYQQHRQSKSNYWDNQKY